MKFLAGTRLGRTGFASVVVVAALGASPAAMADCTGTGLGAALSPLLPFASGGAVNSLIRMGRRSKTARNRKRSDGEWFVVSEVGRDRITKRGR